MADFGLPAGSPARWKFLADEFIAQLDRLALDDPEADAIGVFDRAMGLHSIAEAVWHVADAIRWAHFKEAAAAKYRLLQVANPDPVAEEAYRAFAEVLSLRCTAAGTASKAGRLARRR